MATGQLGAVLRHLHRLAGEGGELTDAQLLQQFAARRDEGAFAALVQRHGPMVLGVCRRVLQNAHDAEDAFQATFLILVRKAASINEPCAALGGWLHQVAYRTALRARDRRASRRQHERQTPIMHPPDILAAVVWRDLQPVLDEEVARLPQKYRIPFVLCYLEGKTYAEAARQLRCQRGSISRLLARARELLRLRLGQRGLTLPAGVLAATLCANATSAAVPATLAAATIKTVLRSATAGAVAAGGFSPRVAALAEGGIKAMRTTAWRITLVLLLAVGLVGAGLGLLADRAPARPGEGQAPKQTKQATAPSTLQESAAKTQRKTPPPAEAKVEGRPMTFTGRVLDEAGKALAGAEVAVIGLRHPSRPSTPMRRQVLATGKTDAKGKFLLRRANVSPRQFNTINILAATKGYALGWQSWGIPALEQKVELRLPAEQVLSGRLVDLQGLPAANVKCRVTFAMKTRDLQWAGWLGEMRPGMVSPVAKGEPLVRFGSQGFSFTEQPAPEGLALWPKPLVTDAKGRFEVRGFGRGQAIDLLVEDDRFALQALTLNADNAGKNAFSQSLAAPQKFEGEVVAEDTGKPMPKVQVAVVGYRKVGNTRRSLGREASTTTDARGRFKINPYQGEFFDVRVHVPGGTPYLTTEERIGWPKGETEHKLRIKVPRGVLVQGKVVDKTSGKPVEWANVYFEPQQKDNPQLPVNLPTASHRPTFSDSDGSFALVVPPGPGRLVARAPGRDFVWSSTTTEELLAGKPAGYRRYFHAVVPLNLKVKDEPEKLTVSVQRGITLNGQVVGPSGKAVSAALMFVPGEILPPSDFGVSILKLPHQSMAQVIRLKDGKFELPNCDPEKTYRVFFIDVPKEDKLTPERMGWMRGSAALIDQLHRNRKGRLGCAADISAKKAAGKPMTIKLAPCGSAQVRLLDKKGNPAHAMAWVELVVTPRQGKGKNLVHDEAIPVTPFTYGIGPDDKTPLSFMALIPGATYRLRMILPGQNAGDIRHEQEFTVKSGKTNKLKDVIVPFSRPAPVPPGGIDANLIKR
jgi:RNA polymerase sigma factor (sigma-70 family)